MLGINQANGGHAASESATQVERRNSTKLNPLSPNGVVNTSTPATAATASDVTAAATTTSAATKLSQQDGRKGRVFLITLFHHFKSPDASFLLDTLHYQPNKM